MRLVLGDDHRMFLDALGAGLSLRGHDVVGLSENVDHLVELVEREDPDLCIFDVDFGGRSVIASVATIRDRLPEVRIVLLAGTATPEVWTAYAEGKVDGLVNKLCDVTVLNSSIERVRAGERVIERFVPPAVRGRPTAGVDRLSSQERRVVRLLVSGASTAQIASELGVSTHTVRSHVQGVFQKLGVNSRAKVATVGFALGATGPGDGCHAG